MDNLSRESTLLSQGTMEAVMSGVTPSDLDMLLQSEQLYGVGDCIHQEATSHMEPDHIDIFSFTDKPDSTQPKVNVPIISSVSTSGLPSMEDYPGLYDFDAELNKSAGEKAKWEHSIKLSKLFIKMDCKIAVKFKANSAETDLHIRALPIFLAQDSLTEPVKRCPAHVSKMEKSNQDFFHVDHIVRCHHARAIYQENAESQRLSVIVPTEPPQPGCDGFTVVYSFMCKNSCSLGMNRRSTALIFTLERLTGEVIGRKLINFRICSCPRRDMQKEELDLDSRKSDDEDEQIMGKKASDRKIVQKKPLKRLSKELVSVRISRKYLAIIRDMILLEEELTEEEKTSVEDLNNYLH